MESYGDLVNKKLHGLMALTFDLLTLGTIIVHSEKAFARMSFSITGDISVINCCCIFTVAIDLFCRDVTDKLRQVSDIADKSMKKFLYESRRPIVPCRFGGIWPLLVS